MGRHSNSSNGSKKRSELVERLDSSEKSVVAGHHEWQEWNAKRLEPENRLRGRILRTLPADRDGLINALCDDIDRGFGRTPRRRADTPAGPQLSYRMLRNALYGVRDEKSMDRCQALLTTRQYALADKAYRQGRDMSDILACMPRDGDAGIDLADFIGNRMDGYRTYDDFVSALDSAVQMPSGPGVRPEIFEICDYWLNEAARKLPGAPKLRIDFVDSDITSMRPLCRIEGRCSLAARRKLV